VKEYVELSKQLYRELGVNQMDQLLIFIAVCEEQIDFLDFLYVEMIGFIEYDRAVRDLEELGLVKRHGTLHTDIMLRKKGEEIYKKHFKARKKQSDIHLWIDTWREIFPNGVNTGGYRYRGSRAESLKKMIKFVANNKYTKEEIIKATQNYVNRFSLKGYAYMQQAHYFIDKKDSGSTLASECEGLSEQKPINQGTPYGKRII